MSPDNNITARFSSPSLEWPSDKSSLYDVRIATDPEFKNELILEAYNRMKLDVNASHILFRLNGNASPSDTLKQYNSALKAKQDIESGIITFKKSNELRDVVKYVPLERMLIETDSPYLSPDPLRGKSNEPANVKIVGEKIAKIKEISFEEVARLTTENFKNFFLNEQR